MTLDTTRLVFIGGLHRSGTTALGRLLAAHPEVSGFSRTGATEDEGQHLQDVYPPAAAYGGPGRFARDPAAHLGPVRPEDQASDRDRLLTSWSGYWDLDRKYLVEKSPPNLIMGRYLQSVFPGSSLVIIVRHPTIVALSTKKWRRQSSLRALVEHWFIAHDLLRGDAPHLQRLHIMRYEDLILHTDQTLNQLSEFLGLQSPLRGDLIDGSRSDMYINRWAGMAEKSRVHRSRRKRIEEQFAERAREYGYDIADLGWLGDSWFSPGSRE